MLVSRRGCSSVVSVVSLPFASRTTTGTISSANRPSSCAAIACSCDRTDSSSCSSRRDAVLPPQVLGRLDHPAGHRVVVAAGRLARPGEPVEQRDRAAAGAVAQRGRVVLDLAHALRTAGDHEVRHAALHLHRAVHHRLQPRAAPTVQLEAGRLDRQPGVERRDAADGRRLAVRVALTEQHVVDVVGAEPRALHECLDDRRGQCRRRQAAEHPSGAPDGRPDRLADDSCPHHVTSFSILRSFPSLNRVSSSKPAACRPCPRDQGRPARGRDT